MTQAPEFVKLTAYFAERQRSGSRFLAEAMLDLFAARGVATSLMLRGIGSFGPSDIVRSDLSLTLSEDPPVTITAVDDADAIDALTDEVMALTERGLITLERGRRVGTVLPESDDAHLQFTLYLGRRQRIAGRPAYLVACEVLYRLGFAGATVFLGVDGTIDGQRRRAKFFSRNVDVPVQLVGIGTPAQAATAAAELTALLPDPLLTVERIQVCKRAGRRLADPPATAPAGQGFTKLTVYTAEDYLHDGIPIHRALIHRLRDSGQVSGATVLRGLWGYRGAEPPHGDRLLTLGRHVPVATVVIDTSAAITRSFGIVDELTAEHGLVTTEVVPVARLLTPSDQGGKPSLG